MRSKALKSLDSGHGSNMAEKCLTGARFVLRDELPGDGHVHFQQAHHAVRRSGQVERVQPHSARR